MLDRNKPTPTMIKLSLEIVDQYFNTSTGRGRAEPIEGPDLSLPTLEAVQPMQMQPAGEGAKRKSGGNKDKFLKE